MAESLTASRGFFRGSRTWSRWRPRRRPWAEHCRRCLSIKGNIQLECHWFISWRQCFKIWQKFKRLWKFFKVYLVFGKILPFLRWQIFFYGPITASFCLFFVLSITVFTENCRLQRDSNLDFPIRRQALWPLDHHHCPPLANVMLLGKFSLHNRALWTYALWRVTHQTQCIWDSSRVFFLRNIQWSFLSPTPTQMTFTWVTKAHGPTPWMSPMSAALQPQQEVTRPKARFKPANSMQDSIMQSDNCNRK